MKPQGVVILASHQDSAKRTWLRLLSEQHGVVQAAAFGARAKSKRFSGGLAPTMWGQAWGEARAGKLRLAGFELEPEHIGLRGDPVAFAAAAYACELASVMLAHDERDAVLFALLREVLRALARHEHAGGWLRGWEIALLSQQGWMTQPGQCSVCGKTDAHAFLESTGQWRCETHATQWCSALQRRTVQALASIYTHVQQNREIAPWIRDGRFPELAPVHRAELRNWSWRWLDQHLVRPLKSRAVLLEIAGK